MKRTNLVLMISAALTLAACGGNSSNDSAPSDPTPPKTAQPTPKPAPTPETSEQEAEKPEAKKPATGGSSGGSGGSYAGGSYGGGSSGGSSGSTGGAGGDTGGGDTGDTGDTGGDDKTGDKDGDEEKEQPAKELTSEQQTEFADNKNNYSEIASGTQSAKVKNADFAKDWSSFTVTAEDGKKTTTVLIPTKAKENAFTDGSREIIETEDFTDFDGVQTASSKVIGTEAGTEFEGKTYISKEYTYSRFGSFTKGKFTEADGTYSFAADGENPTTYYSVGRIDLLPEDANKPPVTGKASYKGIAFIDTTAANMIGDFKGDADFGEKSFRGEISGLKTYKDNSPKDMEEAASTVTETIYNNGIKTKLEFTAKIEGHNLTNEGNTEPNIKVNGSFYGPEAAEVGGVISKANTFSGAFGGKKTKDAAPTE